MPPEKNPPPNSPSLRFGVLYQNFSVSVVGCLRLLCAGLMIRVGTAVKTSLCGCGGLYEGFILVMVAGR